MMQNGKKVFPVAPGVKLRAKERVLAYLEEQFQREDIVQGARLPSGRALAAQLGVSVSTVQAVFQMLTRQGVISTEVGNGSFLLKASKATAQTLRVGVTFGSLSGSPAADQWHLHISGSMMYHVAKMKRELHIVPISLVGQKAAQARATLESYRTRVDGVILRPTEGLAELLDEEILKEMALVHLNPPTPSATANFVSADYFKAWYHVGQALTGARRRSIVNLTEFKEHLGASNTLRHAGLTASIGIQTAQEVQYRMVNAQGHLEVNGYEAARTIFADRKSWPDAIVASGDDLAAGVIRYCEETGISVPEQVSIIGGGGTGVLHVFGRELTRAAQPMEAIGVELIEMLCRLLDARHEGRPVEQTGIFLPMSFTGGGTTRPVENALLGL